MWGLVVLIVPQVMSMGPTVTMDKIKDNITDLTKDLTVVQVKLEEII
jgi:hypothetical protein